MRKRNTSTRLAVRKGRWVASYHNVVGNLPKGLYTGEDIRRVVTPIIGNPHHPNCWGAAFNAVLKSSRFFRPLQKTRAMTSRSSHGRRTRLYRKVR